MSKQKIKNNMINFNQHGNNHIKYKWSKHSIKKANIVRLYKIARPNILISIRNALEIPRHKSDKSKQKESLIPVQEEERVG